MSDIVLSPLSEAKAQLSLKSVELDKHYKQELKTTEAELSALNDKKQLLEATSIQEIAELRDSGLIKREDYDEKAARQKKQEIETFLKESAESAANNALAGLNNNKSTTKTTKKYDLEQFLPDTNAIEKAVREVHLQRDAANSNESQISSKDDDDERDLINSIIHNDRDAAELKDFSKQMKKYTHNKEFNNVDALKETLAAKETPGVTFSFDGLDDDVRQDMREEVAKVKAKKCDRDVVGKAKKMTTRKSSKKNKT